MMTSQAQSDTPGRDGQPPRRPAVSSGNPRITVAFPFSKIEIREPQDTVRDLAVLLARLADQVAVLASQAAPDQAESADETAAQAALLARRLAGE
jgi:hypothetical protein